MNTLCRWRFILQLVHLPTTVTLCAHVTKISVRCVCVCVCLSDYLYWFSLSLFLLILSFPSPSLLLSFPSSSPLPSPHRTMTVQDYARVTATATEATASASRVTMATTAGEWSNKLCPLHIIYLSSSLSLHWTNPAIPTWIGFWPVMEWPARMEAAVLLGATTRQ